MSFKYSQKKVTFNKESEKTNVQVLKEPSLSKTVYFQRIRFLQNILIKIYFIHRCTHPQ